MAKARRQMIDGDVGKLTSSDKKDDAARVPRLRTIAIVSHGGKYAGSRLKSIDNI